MRSWMPITTVPAALIALILVVLSAGATEPDADPKRWLERMLDAGRTLSYEGTFVYMRGQSVEAMHIAHSSVSGEQRLVSAMGPVREVVVRDNSVMCLFAQQPAAQNAVNTSRSLLPVSFPYDLTSLERHYEFSLLGEDRVADRSTRIVEVRPRDVYRYGYKLWLDVQTGMVLRSALMSLDDRYLEHLVFTRFEIKSAIKKSLLQPQLKARYPRVADASAIVKREPQAKSRWVVGATPPGFVRVPVPGIPHRIRVPQTEQRIFSDGLATISVFIEPLPTDAEPLLEGASAMEVANAFGRVIAGFQVLVVGEVPAATAQLIGESISRVEP